MTGGSADALDDPATGSARREADKAAPSFLQPVSFLRGISSTSATSSTLRGELRGPTLPKMFLKQPHEVSLPTRSLEQLALSALLAATMLILTTSALCFSPPAHAPGAPPPDGTGLNFDGVDLERHPRGEERLATGGSRACSNRSERRCSRRLSAYRTAWRRTSATPSSTISRGVPVRWRAARPAGLPARQGIVGRRRHRRAGPRGRAAAELSALGPVSVKIGQTPRSGPTFCPRTCRGAGPCRPTTRRSPTSWRSR